MADTGFDLSEHIFLVVVVVVVLSPLISSINTLTLIQIIYFKIYLLSPTRNDVTSETTTTRVHTVQIVYFVI